MQTEQKFSSFFIFLKKKRVKKNLLGICVGAFLRLILKNAKSGVNFRRQINQGRFQNERYEVIRSCTRCWYGYGWL